MVEPVVGHGSLGVRWKGFRGFGDTGWLELPALTILLGANSSGKSSLIAPLLLMKQSLESRTGTNALMTRGPYVNVGAFRDFAHNHDAESTVSFALRWHSHPAGRDRRSAGEYAPGGIELGFVRGKKLDQVDLSLYRVEDIYRRVLLRRARTAVGRYSLKIASAPEGLKGLPPEKSAARNKVNSLLRDAQPVDFLFTSRQLRSEFADEPNEEEAAPLPAYISSPKGLFYAMVVDYVHQQVREQLFDEMYFLGPLREPPRRVYELSGEMPPDVGTRGEYAPELLYRLGSDSTQLDSIRSWLQHFGLPDTIEFDDVGDEGFAPRFGAGAGANSPLDLGFGLSQLLPLIVQGVHARDRSRLLIEQPEIHLNPRLQAGLADLLVAFANRLSGVVVETHSEHLLLRLRRLVAEGQIDAADVGVYFVDRVKGESRVRRVPLLQSGYIDPKDWPRDFFDDSLRESLALARAQAGRAKSEGSSQ